MKNLFFIILCFYFSPCASNAQNTSVVVVEKADLKKYGIENIKALNCKAFIDSYSVEPKNNSGLPEEETDTYTIHFTNGRLTEINSRYTSFIKYDYLDSLYLEWWKQKRADEKEPKYIDSLLKASLTNANGLYIDNRDGGGNSNVWPCFSYEYQGNLKSISVSNCTDNTEELLFKINFYYDNNAKIKWSKLVYSEGQDTTRTYYLYKENSLVGYYPAKEKQSLPADSIYNTNKLQELNKIGFDSFKKKYFTPEIYKKVIEDCYEPVKSNQLLINNKPITAFLDKIGRKGMKYILFEIADNYFLFYKIID